MFSAAEWAPGAVEGLEEHLFLPQLDEADLPGKKHTKHGCRSPSFTLAWDPAAQGQQGHLTVAWFPHLGFLLAGGPASGARVCLEASHPQLWAVHAIYAAAPIFQACFEICIY